MFAVSKTSNWWFGCLVSLLCVTTACEPAVDISADWQDITVVQGYVEDGAYPGFVVRVSKAFVGDLPVAQMASVPDSSNYTEPMEVSVQEIFNGYATSYVMERDTFNMKPLPGIFPRDGNIWHITGLRNQANKTYKIIVYFPERDKYVTATTHCISRARISQPDKDNAVTSFADPDQPFQVVYYTSAYGEYYQISLTVKWREGYNNGKTAEDRTYRLDLDPKVISPAPEINDPMQTIVKRINYQEIYGALAERIPTDSTIRIRYITGIDLRLFIGTHEYNMYFHSGNEFEFGTTRNHYTNLVNGTGIFSSVGNKYIMNLIPDQRSLDSLAFGKLTRHLKFTNEILCAIIE